MAKGAELVPVVDQVKLQTSITLDVGGDVAFRITDLQLTAFQADPLNPNKLTPIATLLPEFEPDNGYTLGPLVPQRGPIIFSNDEIFPAVVERIIQNPRGIIFKLSIYIIVDETGRDFAFISQDVEERTPNTFTAFAKRHRFARSKKTPKYAVG